MKVLGVLVLLFLLFLTGCNGGHKEHPTQSQIQMVQDAYWDYVQKSTMTPKDYVLDIRHSSPGQYLCSLISQSVDIIYTFFRLVYAHIVIWTTNFYHKICHEVDHLHHHLDHFLYHLEADIHYHAKELAAKIRWKLEDIKQCAAHYVETLDPKGLKIALLEKTKELHEHLDQCFEHLHTHHHHHGDDDHHDHHHHHHHHHHHGDKHPGHHHHGHHHHGHHHHGDKHPGHHHHGHHHHGHHHHGDKHPGHHHHGHHHHGYHHHPGDKHPGHHHHGHHHHGHHHHGHKHPGHHHHHGHKHPGHHHHHGHKHPGHHHHHGHKHPGHYHHHHHGHKHPGHHHHHHHGHKLPCHQHHKHEHGPDLKKKVDERMETFKTTLLSLAHNFDIEIARTTEELNKNIVSHRRYHDKLIKNSEHPKDDLETIWHDWMSSLKKKTH